MPATADPYPPGAPTPTRARRERLAHARRWRAAPSRTQPPGCAPGTCVPEPPSEIRARHDGGDAGPGGGFWAVLRCVLAATAGR